MNAIQCRTDHQLTGNIAFQANLPEVIVTLCTKVAARAIHLLLIGDATMVGPRSH